MWLMNPDGTCRASQLRSEDGKLTVPRRSFLKTAGLTGMSVGLGIPFTVGASSEQHSSTTITLLSPEHIAAINRRRRMIVYFDANFPVVISYNQFANGPAFVQDLFTFADDEGSQIDAIWWFLPLFDFPHDRASWIGKTKEGVELFRRVHSETRKRGLETFYSHRMNGGSHEIPMKKKHPDWCFRTPWLKPGEPGYWNFAFEGVRQYVAENLLKIAREHDLDGMELDFARGVVLPAGQQWIYRKALTDFMYRMRSGLLEIERQRGRPMLLAARVPETLIGCHFDGLDVERWVRDNLVDLFTLGCRAFEVDLPAFRRLLAGTPIRLYPSLDDHHSCDGYKNPGIEVLRGVAANWWRQAADGIHTMNFNYSPNRPYGGEDWPSHRQAYREMGDAASLRYKHKTFVIQRRGGGHGPRVVPNPEDWHTPRVMYGNTNMLSQLPARLANHGLADTLLTLFVGDDLSIEAEKVKDLTLRVLLHDRSRGGYVRTGEAKLSGSRDPGRIEPAVIRKWSSRDFFWNCPPAKGIQDRFEVRINNALLGKPTVDGGWLVWKQVQPQLFAVGENLVGVRVTGRAPDAAASMLVEKLELHVKYKTC